MALSIMIFFHLLCPSWRLRWLNPHSRLAMTCLLSRAFFLFLYVCVCARVWYHEYLIVLMVQMQGRPWYEVDNESVRGVICVSVPPSLCLHVIDGIDANHRHPADLAWMEPSVRERVMSTGVPSLTLTSSFQDLVFLCLKFPSSSSLCFAEFFLSIFHFKWVAETIPPPFLLRVSATTLKYKF